MDTFYLWSLEEPIYPKAFQTSGFYNLSVPSKIILIILSYSNDKMAENCIEWKLSRPQVGMCLHISYFYRAMTRLKYRREHLTGGLLFFLTVSELLVHGLWLWWFSVSGEAKQCGVWWQHVVKATHLMVDRKQRTENIYNLQRNISRKLFLLARTYMLEVSRTSQN